MSPLPKKIGSITNESVVSAMRLTSSSSTALSSTSTSSAARNSSTMRAPSEPLVAGSHPS
jgi:hypothetical protein